MIDTCYGIEKLLLYITVFFLFYVENEKNTFL